MNVRGLLVSTELGDRLLELVAEKEASLVPK
ncbi:hypothetical protein NAEX_02494 [Nannocystis exedens]|nr:hypothetical protein NAEX_02494 [Nannocystis exedens]